MKDQDADESQGEIKENEMLVKRYKGGAQVASPLGKLAAQMLNDSNPKVLTNTNIIKNMAQDMQSS